MTKALFVTQKDLKEFTSANGNIDPNYMVPQIRAAQDLDIEPILGTALYDKISNDILNNTLQDPYLTLVEKYIKPALCWYALEELIPFHAYQLKNGGLFKHQSEDSVVPSKNEISYLAEQAGSRARGYADRLVKYLCANSSDFPEYCEHPDGGTGPDKEYQSFSGINLD